MDNEETKRQAAADLTQTLLKEGASGAQIGTAIDKMMTAGDPNPESAGLPQAPKPVVEPQDEDPYANLSYREFMASEDVPDDVKEARQAKRWDEVEELQKDASFVQRGGVPTDERDALAAQADAEMNEARKAHTAAKKQYDLMPSAENQAEVRAALDAKWAVVNKLQRLNVQR